MLTESTAANLRKLTLRDCFLIFFYAWVKHERAGLSRKYPVTQRAIGMTLSSLLRLQGWALRDAAHQALLHELMTHSLHENPFLSQQRRAARRRGQQMPPT